MQEKWKKAVQVFLVHVLDIVLWLLTDIDMQLMKCGFCIPATIYHLLHHLFSWVFEEVQIIS